MFVESFKSSFYQCRAIIRWQRGDQLLVPLRLWISHRPIQVGTREPLIVVSSKSEVMSVRFRYVMSGVAALLAVTQLSIFWIGQVPFHTFPKSKIFSGFLPGACCLRMAHLFSISRTLLHHPNTGGLRFRKKIQNFLLWVHF